MSEEPAETESISAATSGLDLLETEPLVALLVGEQLRAAQSATQTIAALATAVEIIVGRLAAGGCLHYFGAGTSGRLGILDAAECVPTFGTEPELVQAHIAGGAAAISGAVEGAEDDAEAGELEARDALRPGDVAVGISASGDAPWVVAAIRTARTLGAATIAVTSNPGSALVAAAEHSIVASTGAEALSGSTRMGAALAQKIALATLTTAAMVRLGRVYDNLMVDLVATNEKLRRRAIRLVRRLTGLDEPRARELLEQAEGSVKLAVVMERRGLDLAGARKALEGAGSLRALIEK